jgi:hypothetical protein
MCGKKLASLIHGKIEIFIVYTNLLLCFTIVSLCTVSFSIIDNAAPPYWRLKPVSLVVSATDYARFDCLADGIPAPTVAWFINGRPIEGMNKKSTATAATSCLRHI